MDYTGDAAYVDEDGYFFFSGRADEIMKVAGHRIGTIEVENAFLRNPAVAEAGVIGRPDELRGEVICAFVTLKKGYEPSTELKASLLKTVRQEMGPVVVIGDIYFVPALPKTRPGRSCRCVLKSVLLDRDPGDVSTIEEEGSVEEARHAWQAMRGEIAEDPRPPNSSPVHPKQRSTSVGPSPEWVQLSLHPRHSPRPPRRHVSEPPGPRARVEYPQRE